MSALCISPGREWIASMIGWPLAAVLDDPAAEVGEAGLVRRCRARGVVDDRVVHEVGDVTALVRVQPEREAARARTSGSGT